MTYTVIATNYENPNCNCFYRQKIKLPYHIISFHPHFQHSHPDSPRSHHSPYSVPRFPIPDFTDSQKTNKPTITLIIIVLTFGEIGSKESINDFWELQTLWLLTKNHEFIKRKLIYRFLFIL